MFGALLFFGRLIMRYYEINEAEALRACIGLIDAYEEGELMSEVRTRFAKQMFWRLGQNEAQVVVRSYPFRDIITKYDMLCLY